MQKFVEWLEIANIPAKKMIFKEEETDRFNKATNCWICKGELGEDKVRDHAIIQVNIEVPLIMNVISNIGNLNLHLWYSIILVVMIAIYL